jgi:1,4-dihydroxy-6-naphthoate synthase
LGAIVVRRDLSEAKKHQLNTDLRESVRYALQNPREPDEFVARHAQAMDIDVCLKHIELYVNDFSVNLGETGKQAVELFFEKGTFFRHSTADFCGLHLILASII